MTLYTITSKAGFAISVAADSTTKAIELYEKIAGKIYSHHNSENRKIAKLEVTKETIYIAS